jgi:NAD(P)-dependent dehydrogenase (short-subunit alcohol dehydrogenase family)
VKGFEGKVAVVTGAGSGLGRSHAALLATLGAKVVVNDVGREANGSRETLRADRVVQEIRAAGGIAVPDYSSVSTLDGGEAIIQSAVEEFGSVDILVNNAGTIRPQSLSKLDWGDLDVMIDVHLKGTFYVTKPAYLRMRERNYGRIVFTTSASALFGIPGVASYAAAKAGVLGLMHVLKLEGERFGVRANAIAPVAANTGMGREVYPQEHLAGAPPEAHEPGLVSAVVAYFSSEECTLTGELWSVAAGSVARIFVGRTGGYFKHPIREGPLRVDDIAAHIPQIREETSYTVPYQWSDEWEGIARRLAEREVIA